MPDCKRAAYASSPSTKLRRRLLVTCLASARSVELCKASASSALQAGQELESRKQRFVRATKDVFVKGVLPIGHCSGTVPQRRGSIGLEMKRSRCGG